MDTTILVYILMVCLSAYAIGVAYLSYAKAKGTLRDFYLAGGSIKTIYLIMSVGASWFSIWFMMGAVGSFYKHGVGFNEFFILNFLHATLIWVLARRLWLLGKRHDYVTPGDMLAKYYKSEFFRVAAFVITLACMIPYIAVQLMGAGIAFESISNGEIPYWVGGLWLLLMTTIYVLSGGLRGVIWMDFGMAFFFMAAMWGSALWLLFNPNTVATDGTTIISLTSMFHALQAKAPAMLTYPGGTTFFRYPNFLSYMVAFSFAAILLPHIWMKYYGASSGSNFRYVPTGIVFFAAWGFFPVLILAFIGKAVLGDVSDIDSVGVLVIGKYNITLAAIFVFAAFMAGMSTVAAQGLAVIASLQQDIYHRYINKEASEQKGLRIAKYWMVALFVMSYYFALQRVGGIVAVSAVAFSGAALFICPVIGVVFFRRGGKVPAITSMVVAWVVLILFTYVGPFKNPLGVYAGGWAILIEFAIYFLMIPFCKPADVDSAESHSVWLKDYLAHNEVKPS